MSTNKPAPTDLPSAFEALEPDRTALFFDFDGVLADIASDPSAVKVRSEVRQDLASLAEQTDGALAIVSGREIADLDRYLSPLHLAAAGVHGAERRSTDGTRWRDATDEALLHAIWEPLLDFSQRKPGLIVERKPFSVALHYRRRPELESDCIAFAEEIAVSDPGIAPLKGKMVVELKTSSQTKADAIAGFMAEPAFEGRTPIFFGDDVTDEDGFAEINRRDGLSVKIGDGETVARFRLADTGAFRSLIETTARRWFNPSVRRRRAG